MTDFLEEQHAQVGLAALQDNPDIVAVFDGKVPDPTPDPPVYVLVYTEVSWPRDGLGTSLSAQQVAITTTYVCHCVGTNAASARAVGTRVRESLLNLRPVIPGRNCSPIKQDEVLAPNRDETTGQPVMDQVLTFSFRSTG